MLYSSLNKSNVSGANLEGARYRFTELFIIQKFGYTESRFVGVYSAVADVEKVNDVFHNKVGSEQLGALAEVSHDFTRFFNYRNPDTNLKGFLRAEYYDSHYRTIGIEDISKYEHWDYSLGIVFQPVKTIELKVDYQILRSGGHASQHMFDFSIGFKF